MKTIHVDQFLAHPPAKVWRALTEPDLLARWLMPNDFQPVVGHRFTMHTAPVPATGFDGTVHCQVLALDPPKLMSISWCGSGAQDLKSTVTFRLAPEGNGTRLLLEHAGFDPESPAQMLSFKIMDGGWRSHVMRSLATTLAAIDT